MRDNLIFTIWNYFASNNNSTSKSEVFLELNHDDIRFLDSVDLINHIEVKYFCFCF